MLKPRRPTGKQLRRLYLKLTDDQIGAIYGVTGRSVHDWRVKHDIARSALHRRRYTLDVDFFAKIDTEEKAKAVSLWRMSGYRGSKQILHWMYEDAAIYLRRKHQIFLEHWQ